MKKIFKKGFTIIELVVVITIIAVLSTIVISNVNDSRMKARNAARKAQLKEMQKALELYYAEKGNYPEALIWRGIVLGDSRSGDSGYIPNLAPQYMGILPVDPAGGESSANNAGYFYRSNKISYKLISQAPASYGPPGPEGVWSNSDAFADPARPYGGIGMWHAWMVCSGNLIAGCPDSVQFENSNCPCSWN